MQLSDVFSKASKNIASFGNFLQVPILLFFRLNWGLQFFQTGQGKLINHGKIVEFFSSLNLPMPDATAWFVGGVECVGGLLLLVGLLTRPVGLVLTINMIVAYLSVEDDRNTIFNFFKDQDPFFKADPLFYLLASLLCFSFGGGPLSLDTLLKKLYAKNEASPPGGVQNMVDLANVSKE
jgi:putative oxidoreductase